MSKAKLSQMEINSGVCASNRAYRCYNAASEINYLVEQNCKVITAIVDYESATASTVAEIQQEKFSLFHHARQCAEAASEFAFSDPAAAGRCADNARIAVENIHAVYNRSREIVDHLLGNHAHRIEIATAEAFKD